jgi:hypothetical protein
MISHEEFDAKMLAERKSRLFKLMHLKARNKGIEIEGLDDYIVETKVCLRQEDVDWVENLLKDLP